MSLDITIREICAGLLSQRANERRKNAEALKEYLSMNAVPSLLTENTLKLRGYNWNNLFDGIYEYILKETERHETSKSFENVTLPLCSNLILSCVAGANKGQAYIKCEKVIEASLFILKDKRLTKAAGDVFLTLLYKHVLTVDFYIKHMLPSLWEELLETCLSVTTKIDLKLDSYTKLKIVWLILHHGHNCCQFSAAVRDSLPYFTKCFHCLSSEKKAQEILIDIMVVLLEMLSFEYRHTMCEFTETKLIYLINFYDQNMDLKKKISLFKCLKLIVMLHHPNGRVQGEVGCLANDWESWNTHLKSMLDIVCVEVSHSPKFKKYNESSLNCDSDFSYFAACVYRQIFHLHSGSSTNDDLADFSKRQRISVNNSKTFSDILDEFKVNSSVWLGIIHMFVKNYGFSINMSEYLALIAIMEALITGNNAGIKWDVLQDTFCSVVSNLSAADSAIENKCIQAAVLSFLNSCIRNCYQLNSAHEHLHTITQYLLSLDFVKPEQTQQLCTLYLEKGMPVTDYSLKTLNVLFRKCFSSFSAMDKRKKLFSWTISENITNRNINVVNEFLLRLLSNENVHMELKSDHSVDYLFSTIFGSFDDCLLFSEFEKNSSPSLNQSSVDQVLTLNIEMNKLICSYLENELSENIKLEQNDTELLNLLKLVHVVVVYVNTVIRQDPGFKLSIDETTIIKKLENALMIAYKNVSNILGSNCQKSNKILILNCLKEMFSEDFDPSVNDKLRCCVDEHFFHCLHSIIRKEMCDNKTDEYVYDENDNETNPFTLRHSCINLFACYCIKKGAFQEEILDLIFDNTLYNFRSLWEVDCAFDCLSVLGNDNCHQIPLEHMFTLMQNMCKELFRNSDVTQRLVKLILKFMDKIWLYENSIRLNCIIMVRSFLQRCSKQYYPPHVAALIYECAAKMINLIIDSDPSNADFFKETVLQKIKDNNFSIRLYCSYLLKYTDTDAAAYASIIDDIFIINVCDKSHLIIKDESLNRTMTVLHGYYSLSQKNGSVVFNIVANILKLHKDKCLDKCLLKKILNKIVNHSTQKDIESYLDLNILPVLNFWLLSGYNIKDIPIHFFGLERIDMFYEKYAKWAIPAEVLWSRGGNIQLSDSLEMIKGITTNSTENLLELCFCQLIVLCLPYIVVEKYHLDHIKYNIKNYHFLECSKAAICMFQMTRQILNNKRWSNLFVENLGELVLTSASFISDPVDARKMFATDLREPSCTYYFSKDIFSSVLKYFGELIDGDIINYLCQNQPITICKILLNLWQKVLLYKGDALETKVLSLHSYVTFVECIPFGFSTDVFVCNFTCRSLTHALKKAASQKEVKVLLKALKICLHRYIPEKLEVLRKSLSDLLSVLIIKKEEGYVEECCSLLDYLIVEKDINNKQKTPEDVIDFVNALSQGIMDNYRCLNKLEFIDKLNTFKPSLICPSYDNLNKLRRYLESNKQYTNILLDDLEGEQKIIFSENCRESIIHQIISLLINILTSSTHKKTTIEACGCLSAIATYDLKTLITVAPNDTAQVISIMPIQYFVMNLLRSLTDNLFDEDPLITSEIVTTLKYVLKSNEAKDLIDLKEVDKYLLEPFCSSDGNIFSDHDKIDSKKFVKYYGKEFLKPMINESCDQWLTRITSVHLEIFSSVSYNQLLRSVCVSKPNISQKILPGLIGMLICYSADKDIDTISQEINIFFNHIWQESFVGAFSDSDSNSDNGLQAIQHDLKMIIQCMLYIVDFVRLQKVHYKTRPRRRLENINYLNLDYAKVAWAATVANQHLTAIYYAEMWTIACNKGVPPSTPEAMSYLPEGESVQRILRKSFISIGDMDAVEGCGTTHLTDEDEKRRHLLLSGRAQDALSLYDVALSGSLPPAALRHLSRGLVDSLYSLGLHHLALQYISSLPENEQLDDIKFDCLSILGDWNDYVDINNLEAEAAKPNSKIESILKGAHYACLKDCITLKKTPNFETLLKVPIEKSKLIVTRLCRRLNMENCQNVYKVVSKLQLFSDIEDYFTVRCDKMNIIELLRYWQVDKLPRFQDFKYIEPLLLQRSTILEHAVRMDRDYLNEVVSLHMNYAELSLSNNNVPIAQRLLNVIKKLKNCEETSLMESRICWIKGQKEIALSLIRNIIATEPEDTILNAISLRQLGVWMAETKGDNVRDIINDYLMKSLEILEKRRDGTKTRLKVYRDIARFADAEYKQVVSYMISTAFENKVKCMTNMKGTVCSLRSTQQSLTRDEKKALVTNDRFSDLDEAEISNTKAERKRFLELALKYYILYLQQCDEEELLIFRVAALWLESSEGEAAGETARGAGSGEDPLALLASLPTCKFVPVLPQLAPRLSDEPSAFNSLLTNIIKKCALDHPHHTLPLLFSLKNSDKDRQILNASVGASRKAGGDGGEPRVRAAAALVRRLADAAPLKHVIPQMEKICDAIISFANYKPKTKESKQQIPNAEFIHKLKNLNAIPIPTVTVPVQRDCNYSQLITLISFDNKFELVGGINCPKKVTCHSSDGKKRVLLVKGEDDLRQDAVMQQVFTIVNTLLGRDAVASRSHLLVRTYKVVAMSRRSGVLQWCEGTAPLGSYLAGPNGAHARYRPQDISTNAARAKLSLCHEERRSNAEKLAAFLKILREFKPVFHYFFTEHYLDPVTWYERRLAYTKSVATSSMVGYVLGLGDRHVQNILIDENSAEVIHIDFGIAFDQGKVLPTPETVPFRLTQDMVAGFGCSGVEGVFRRCCEKCLRVLREHESTLLTILEVLLCDPLYCWTLTAHARSSKKSVGLAQRALLAVGSKLGGAGVGVAGHVTRLIHDARDPHNLSRLFPGWQPYL